MKRLNIITLGVDDLESSRDFYEKLFDWKPHHDDNENIAFYNMGGWYFALFPREKLAEDATVKNDGKGFSGVTLAHNCQTKQEVQPFIDKAVSLGARQVKPAQDVFWGGHSGYFTDPNGHYWEVAFNPFTKTLEDGFLDIPKH